MDLEFINKRFPDRAYCIKHLEKIRWATSPVCPYCKSINSTPVPAELRHHCNLCNTSFSVTVGTLFHKTQLPFQKWFYAIWIFLNHRETINYRALGKELGVTKDTARYMIKRIDSGTRSDDGFLKRVTDASDFYEYGGI